MTDLREKVATLIYLNSKVQGDICRKIADAVLAIARPAIIEEAAQFLESWYSLHDDAPHKRYAMDAAREMRRALAEKP